MRRCQLIVGIVWLAIGAVASAQPLVDRLPASTLVYTGWSPGAALQNTKAAKMLADERFVQPWRALLQTAVLSLPDELAAGGGKLSEHFPKLLNDAAQCEGCFAVLELKQTKDGVNAQAVLVLSLGARRKDFEEHFKPINARIKDRLGERVHMLKHENSWLWVKTNHEQAEYTWGFVGDSFVFYLGDGAEKFLPTLAAPRDKPLKTSPAFVDCISKIPGDSLLTTYVDAKVLLELAHGILKGVNEEGLSLIEVQWTKVIAALGIDNLKSIGEKTTIEDDQFVTRSLLRTEGQPHGLAASLIQPAVDDAMLKVVPQDAMFAAAVRLDLSKTYDQLKSAAIAIAGEDGRKAFGEIEDAAVNFGVPVNDLLGPIGEQWVVYEAASTGGFFFTGLTLVVDVKDADKLGRTLTALKQLLAKQVTPDSRTTVGEYDSDGVAIQYLRLGADGISVFRPAWAVVDKKLYIGLYPQIVEDAVRQAKAGKSLLDNPQYVSTRKQTGGEGPMFYLSGPEFIRSSYPAALLLISIARELPMAFSSGSKEETFPFAELFPSQQRLLMYVGSDAASIKITPDGILRTKSVANPLLSPLTLTDSIPLWMAAALPALSSSKVTADRTHSAMNLRQLGQGMVLYANENKNKMPPDLATVVKGEDVPKEALHSPFSTNPGDADYKYLMAGMVNSIPADIVVAYDAIELENGEGANVLYGDLHVEWLDHEGINTALEKTFKWREEQKAKVK